MKARKKQKRVNSVAFRVVIVAVVVFAFVKLVQAKVQYNKLKAEEQQVAESVKIAKILNEDLQNKVDNFDKSENYDRYMYENNYIGSSDQVLVLVVGEEEPRGILGFYAVRGWSGSGRQSYGYYEVWCVC